MKRFPDDESREAHKAPEFLRELVAKGRLGAKVKKGFYTKVGRDILSINPETFEYEPPKEMNLGDINSIKKAGSLVNRLKALYADDGRAGAFFRESTLDLIGYCARRVPEIADKPADIDNAICWGFGWQMGPFQVWDALGFQNVLNDLREANIELPAWVDQMVKDDATAFYQASAGQLQSYQPGTGYVDEPVFADQISLGAVKETAGHTLIERKEAALLDLGDGVALYEFRSKSNALGNDVVEGIFEAIDYVENNDFHGLVIGNEGRNFTVGANLGEVAIALMEGKWDLIDGATRRFQEMIKRVRYARKPVVTAIQGMVLGGGCEISLASAATVAAFESYVGLVELGAGLIPGGGGCVSFAARAGVHAPSDFVSHHQPFMLDAFQTIATARVSTSAREAVDLGLLKPNTKIAMHADRRIHMAKEEVLRLSNQGYMPPPLRANILVLGQPGLAAMKTMAYQMAQAGYASEYDAYLGEQLAYILCGGDLTAATEVHEDYLFDLERKVFIDLLKQKKTQERIESILKTNKPLRN